MRIILALLLFWLAFPAQAGIIYKCRQAGGVVSYQDEPCPGRQIGLIRTSAPAPPRPAPAATAKPAAPATAAPGTTTAPAPAAPAAKARPNPTARAPRPSFRCARPDGSIYFSGDARTKRTLVAIKPGLPPPPPVTGAPPAPPGRTWVQDDCQVATRSDTCKYYADQIAYNDAQQARAKGDALRRFTREGQRLRTIRNHRCE